MRSWAERRTRAAAPKAALPARPRRIFILPTGAGVAFAATVLLLLAAALNHTNNLALFLSCLLAAVGVVAAVHTHRTLAQITMLGARLTPVFCGEDAPCAVQVRVPGKAGLILEVCAEHGPWTPQMVQPGTAHLHTPLPTTRRGQISWVEIGMATAAPLGLFRAWTFMRLPVHGVIYPTPWAGGCPVFPIRPMSADGHSPQLQRAGDDPQDLRPYRRGDAPTRIAWKTTARSLARGGPLVVFDHSDGQGAAVLLHWEACPGQGEERIQRLTACVEAAARAQLCYGLYLPGMVIVPEKGEAQRHRCLEALALLPWEERPTP